jgi:hypothetical protein
MISRVSSFTPMSRSSVPIASIRASISGRLVVGSLPASTASLRARRPCSSVTISLYGRGGAFSGIATSSPQRWMPWPVRRAAVARPAWPGMCSASTASSAALSASASSSGSSRRATSGPEVCCRTWASSWASSASPVAEPGV